MMSGAVVECSRSVSSRRFVTSVSRRRGSIESDTFVVVVENLRGEEVTIGRRGLAPYLEDRTCDRGARHRERV